jgi:hypothetical protein
MKKYCRAVIPIRLPYPCEGPTQFTQKSINQILKLSEGMLLSEDHKCSVAIKMLKITNNTVEHIDIPIGPREYVLLEFSSTLDYEPEAYKEIMPDKSEEFRLGLFNCNTSCDFAELIHKIVFCANIALPGSIHTEAGAMYIDDEYDRLICGMKSSLELLSFFRGDIIWPKVQKLSFKRTWDWMNSLDDFRDGFGKSNLGRSLAFFSYLFTSEYGRESPMEDLYIITALEAIYNSNGSQRELVTKIQLFLGAPPVAKATIIDLYKNRSKLIHGGTDLPFWFADNDGLPQVKKFQAKSMEFRDSSLALLISTFQRMCCKGIHEIQFEMKLRGRQAR